MQFLQTLRLLLFLFGKRNTSLRRQLLRQLLKSTPIITLQEAGQYFTDAQECP